MDRDYDALFRIMILGDTGVGKTCLLQRFCDNEFRYSHVCTIGIDFKMKTMVLNGIRVRIQIWDTAGQERYRSITRQYFQKAQFGDEDVSVILVANKSDREDSREISNQSGKELAEELRIPFYEVSAYTSENVAEMFASITSLVLDRFEVEIKASMNDKKYLQTSESDEDDYDDEVTADDIKPGESKLYNNEKEAGYSCCQIL